MYKSKLYLVLKTLGVQNIEELMEKESPYLVRVALEIREAAEIGGFFSASQPVIEADAEKPAIDMCCCPVMASQACPIHG